MLAAGRLDGSPRRNVKYERRPARAQPPVNTRDVTNAGLQLQRRARGRGWRGWCLRPRVSAPFTQRRRCQSDCVSKPPAAPIVGANNDSGRAGRGRSHGRRFRLFRERKHRAAEGGRSVDELLQPQPCRYRDASEGSVDAISTATTKRQCT